MFSVSWGHFNSQENLKTMLMQNFGVTNKECYGIFCNGQFHVVGLVGMYICYGVQICSTWLRPSLNFSRLLESQTPQRVWASSFRGCYETRAKQRVMASKQRTGAQL